MSFSISIPNTPIDDLPAAFDTASEHARAGASDATVESIEAAKATVLALAASGVLGTATVSGYVSGHANPGHAPMAGWANDSITVSLSSTETLAAQE